MSSQLAWFDICRASSRSKSGRRTPPARGEGKSWSLGLFSHPYNWQRSTCGNHQPTECWHAIPEQIWVESACRVADIWVDAPLAPLHRPCSKLQHGSLDTRTRLFLSCHPVWEGAEEQFHVPQIAAREKRPICEHVVFGLGEYLHPIAMPASRDEIRRGR